MDCPNCGTLMQKESQPDVDIERCPSCGGVFLDKGELNVLATGMAGDIEYCSIEREDHEEHLPIRRCPQCPDEEMHKINLLHLTDVIFDCCPNCGGFFLDKGEIEQINQVLQRISDSESGEEFRQDREGHLVKMDRLSDIVLVLNWKTLGLFSSPAGVQYFRVTVYFKKPLNIRLRVFRERWTTKLAKAFGVHRAEDLHTGDAAFDEHYVVRAGDVGRARELISREVQKAMLDFSSRKPRILSKPGSLEIFDDRLVYLEGPYPVEKKAKVQQAAEPIVEDLLSLAKLIES